MADEKKKEDKKGEKKPEAKAEAPKAAPKAAEKKEEGPQGAPVKGILGTKIGMTRVHITENQMIPVTVISVEGNIVSQVKTTEKDGYNAVQVGYGDVLERKISKAEAKHFSKNKLPLKRHTMEFRVKDTAAFALGQPVLASSFKKGEWVQVSGLSKGKGFTGVIKRYGFSGGPHSHGHGEYRRSPGSSGGQGPQHVLPGTKKPGHKGNVWSTEPTMEVAEVDVEKNLILVRGSIPGSNGNFVVVKDTNRQKPVTVIDAPAKKGKGKK